MKNNKRIKRIMCVWTSLVLSATVFVTSAFATGGDPLTVVNNFSDFIFSCIKAVGIIILGWGIVQVGMSVQSHDASQRSQGFLCLFPFCPVKPEGQCHEILCGGRSARLF